MQNPARPCLNLRSIEYFPFPLWVPSSLGLFFLFACLSFPVESWAQNGYVATDQDDPGGPVYSFIFIENTGLKVCGPGDDISSASPVANGGINSSVQLAEPFLFYGEGFSDLTPSSNGYISTATDDLGDDYTNDTHLPTSPSNGGGGRIYPLHDDFVISPSGGIYYAYFYNSPHPHGAVAGGCHVFQWDNVYLFGGSPDRIFDFEVLLFDNGDILYQYGLSLDPKADSATIGIQNPAATAGTSYAINDPAALPAKPSGSQFYPSYAVLIAKPPLVTNLSDAIPSPLGSLRRALETVPNGGNIEFIPSLDGGEIQLVDELVIGPGREFSVRSDLLPNGLRILAAPGKRVLSIGSGASISMQNLTLSGGRAVGGSYPANCGGGIFSEGTLQLANVAIEDCTASLHGGGLYYAVGSGVNHMLSSRISGCEALTGQGGGIFNAGISGFDGSSISGNIAATDGGGVFNINEGALTFSSVYGNTATRGGGIFNAGGSTFVVRTCTLAENRALTNGGGAFSASTGNLELDSLTVAYNTAGSLGGGVHMEGAVSLENTLIAENSASVGGPDLWGLVTTRSGNNLVGDSSGVSGLTGDDLTNLDARLGPLSFYPALFSDWSGKVDRFTIPLLAGSPAIDATGLGTYEYDQRSSFRDRDGDGIPSTTENDIGAYEAGLPYLVDTKEDSVAADGKTSLREAIAAAAGAGSRILFDPAVFSGPSSDDNRIQMVAALGPLYLDDRRLSIDATNIPGGVQIRGGGSSLLDAPIRLWQDAIISMHNLEIRDCTLASISINPGSEITADHCQFSGNSGAAFISEEGSAPGSAVYLEGRARFFNCSMLHNTSVSGGGAVFVRNSGDLFCRSCLFKGNTAFWGGAILTENPSRVALESCSLIDNRAANAGAAIYSQGELNAINTTFSENRAKGSGGAVLHEGIASSDTATFIHCTIAGNFAALGGGIAGVSPVVLINSVVSGNEANTDPDIDVNIPLTESGNNLIGGDPKLAPVGYYGGELLTVLPLAGSPVIDAGASLSGPTYADQRGLPRISGATVDIGAVEVGPLRIVDTKDNVIDAEDGKTSLKEAILQSVEPGARIQFNPEVFTGPDGADNRILMEGEFIGNKHLSIDATNISGGVQLFGPEAPFFLNLGAVDLTVQSGGSLSIHNLQLTHVFGSAVDVRLGGTFTADRCQFTDNTINHSILMTTFSPAMTIGGKARLIDCTLGRNLSEQQGGGAVDLKEFGELTCLKCLFTDNEGVDAGAISVASRASLEIFDSAMINNISDNYGGAIYTEGHLRVANTTFANNRAWDQGGAVMQMSVPSAITDSKLIHCTLVGNESSTQGGALASNGEMILENSIVSGNGAPAGPDIIPGMTFITVGTNLIGGEALLSPLGDYGGPTPSMMPLPGSPAIDALTESGELVDQRGRWRDGTPDIGAVEYAGAGDLAYVWESDWDSDGVVYGVEHAVGTNPFLPDRREPKYPVFATDGSGSPGITMGLDTAAADDTIWIVWRSTDLVTFEEIYRFDGPTQIETLANGIVANFFPVLNPEQLSIFDTLSPSPRVFYMFEALIANP